MKKREFNTKQFWLMGALLVAGALIWQPIQAKATEYTLKSTNLVSQGNVIVNDNGVEVVKFVKEDLEQLQRDVAKLYADCR